MPPNRPSAKAVVKKQPPLPIGVGRVPKWWMDLTPHDKLDLAEHEAQKKIQEQMAHYYLKLAAAGLVGQDGHLVTLPDGQPDWSRIQEQRIRLNPKLFGVSDKDPDFHFYESGEMLPQEFKLKMQEMYGSITPNQREYKKYGAAKDDNKPGWAKMKLKHSKEGDMIRSGVDIDEGPNSYSRRFGGTSGPGEKPAVMIVGGRRLVRKVRRVPKKSDSPPTRKPAATQRQPQQAPRRVSKTPPGMTGSSGISKIPQGMTGSRRPSKPPPQANAQHNPSASRRIPSATQRRISPPPTRQPSRRIKPTGIHAAPRAQQAKSSLNNNHGANGNHPSRPTNHSKITQYETKAQEGNAKAKQHTPAQSPFSRKTPLARTPPKGRIKRVDDQSEAETPVTTNNRHVHSERLINSPLLNEPPSIRVKSYQPLPQGDHFQNARAGLKKTPPKPSTAPSWRQTHEKTAHNYQSSSAIAAQHRQSNGEPRGTHKLTFLADEDDSEPAIISPAPEEENYEEEEYEEVVDEYFDQELYYEEEEEILSIHEVFVDEETVEEDGSSYYEEEVIDDSGEIEYYEETDEEEAINELQAKLAAKQAQLARLR